MYKRQHLGGHVGLAEVLRAGEADVDGDVVGEFLRGAGHLDQHGVDATATLHVQVAVDHVARSGLDADDVAQLDLLLQRDLQVVEHERATLETLSRNEGKPEAALPKIVEGRVQGFFKEVALLEQPYAKDDSKSITQFIGSASIVRYAQVEIG